MSNVTVPFFRPSFSDDEKKAVCSCIDSGWLTTGKITHDFEDKFARFIGSKYALAVNSNTSGMILALEACGVKNGNAVITTPYTFVSTASSAVHLGADVFFADTEKDSYSINPDNVEKILQNDREHKIKAIIPVHIAGNLCNMKKICALAEKYSTADNKIFVIEDCAHSFPSKINDGYAGTLGDVGVFSFYATKTMTTGEGGMVTTNISFLAERMSCMRLHGMNRDAWDRYTSPKASWQYDIVAPGFKFNLPDVLSAIGIVQLEKAELFAEKRKKIVSIYNNAFKDMDFLTLPPDSPGNAWHLYLLRLNLDKIDCSRDIFAKELQDEGIGISMHFIPIYHFSFWKEKYPLLSPEDFCNAEDHFQRTISIPLWPDMSVEMAETVIQTVKKIGMKHYASKKKN